MIKMSYISSVYVLSSYDMNLLYNNVCRTSDINLLVFIDVQTSLPKYWHGFEISTGGMYQY